VPAALFHPLPSLLSLVMRAGELDGGTLRRLAAAFPSLRSLSLTGDVTSAADAGGAGAFSHLALPALPALAHLDLDLCHCPPAADVAALYAGRELASLAPAYDGGDMAPVIADVAAVAALPRTLTVRVPDTAVDVSPLAAHPRADTLVALRMCLVGEVTAAVGCLAAFASLADVTLDVYSGDGLSRWPPLPALTALTVVQSDGAAADALVDAITSCPTAAATLRRLTIVANRPLAGGTLRGLGRLRALRHVRLAVREADALAGAGERAAYERQVWQAVAPPVAVAVTWSDEGVGWD